MQPSPNYLKNIKSRPSILRENLLSVKQQNRGRKISLYKYSNSLTKMVKMTEVEMKEMKVGLHKLITMVTTQSRT